MNVAYLNLGLVDCVGRLDESFASALEEAAHAAAEAVGADTMKVALAGFALECAVRKAA